MTRAAAELGISHRRQLALRAEAGVAIALASEADRVMTGLDLVRPTSA